MVNNGFLSIEVSSFFQKNKEELVVYTVIEISRP